MSKTQIKAARNQATRNVAPAPIKQLPLTGVRVRPVRRRPYVGLAAGLAVCLLVGLGVALGARGGIFNSAATTQAVARSQAELTCERFLRLKNAGDPEALLLLRREPQSTSSPLTQEELDQAQTDFFLRDAIRIRAVVRADEQPRDPQAGIRFILVTEGRVAAPDLLLKTRHGTHRSGRTMLNPDLIVEVREGKLYGHHAELHMGP